MGVNRYLMVAGAVLLMAAGSADAGGDNAASEDRLRLDQQTYGLLRYEWGQYAHLNDITMLRGDVTCDGREDRVLGWLDRDSPEGLFYRVMLATDAVGKDEAFSVLGDIAAMSVSLPADRKGAVHMEASEPLLCSRGELPEVTITLEPHTKAETVALTGIDGACSTAIRLDDGLCDSIRLFWLRRPVGRPVDGERFVLHRN
ncbi:hypothetical protein [Oceanibaculum indicum]|uniref:Lipoprotein n=1 Tax=Oceanibaculum indicum TaxID=526216 RepID=A0A420WHP8_9PROT|nr:hypothetical protein [Oceanibaculum indicum]RKQ70492.1 hypothetical protein BCL74_2440 [Oceanibaculum indicum]